MKTEKSKGNSVLIVFDEACPRICPLTKRKTKARRRLAHRWQKIVFGKKRPERFHEQLAGARVEAALKKHHA